MGQCGRVAWSALVPVLALCGNATCANPRPLPIDTLRAQQWARNTSRVAVVQLPAPHACLPEAKSCTHAVTAADMGPLVEYIERAAADEVDLVLFPEYHMVNIHLNQQQQKKPNPATTTTVQGQRQEPVAFSGYANPAVAAVSAAAKKARIYVAVGSWVLLTPGTQRVNLQYTNSILIFGRDGKIMGMYNKTHAAVGQGPYFWPPLTNDTEINMVVGKDYPVFDLDFARIGVQTCYDGYFPEPMRALALQGAEIVLWPNSRGGGIEANLVSASSFFNMVHVAAVNSANGEGSTIFSYPSGGNANPCGKSPNIPCYLAATLDLHSLRVARKHSRMFHQRRPELAAIIGEDWATSQFYDKYPDDKLK